MKIIFSIGLCIVLFTCFSVKQNFNMFSFKYKSKTNFILENDSVKNIFSEIKFDSLEIINKMAYVDTVNFMKQKIYPCAKCFLRPEVAQALNLANRIAKDKGFKLVVYDCYRPYQYQKVMYDIVNNPKYVALPGKGSNHNRGLAIDLSLADNEGNILNMGNEFDDFSELSHYSAAVSKEAKNNRKILRTIMVKAGFTPYDNEWWHFDYKKKPYDTANFVWECD